MIQVKELTDEEAARRIGEFMTSENAFEQTWAPNEKASVMAAPAKSLSNPNHQYWYVEQDGNVIAAIGVCENKYGSKGFEMDSDYLAVHKDHRRKGIATALLEYMERFVEKKQGRYVHILTCDIDSYDPARIFWENRGYDKVAVIPNYYVNGEGRVDYYKEFNLKDEKVGE